MSRLSKIFVALALVALSAGAALALGTPNSAVIIPRVFNDSPFSILTTTNIYPTGLCISDQSVAPAGWANLHIWRLSQDGVTPMEFANNDGFAFGASVRISGDANGEAGLQISPWWSLQVDGRFNIRTPDGEVAVFGGRLPFYSFTANHGKVYTKGNWVHLTMIYRPNMDMDAAHPATIEYIYDDGLPVSSGQIPFDEGNPAEDPPHGVYGILNFAHVGGYLQFNNMSGSIDQTLKGEYCSFTFVDLGSVVATEVSSFGAVKALFR